MASRTDQPQQQSSTARPIIANEKEAQALVKQAQSKFLSVSRRNPEALKPAWAREAAFASQIIMKSEPLRKAEPTSLVNAVINLASVGLTFNPVKQHATIVPRYNVDIGGYEGHLMVMYRGFIYLATQAGITDVIADVVYDQDEFMPITRTEKGDTYKHVINVKAPRDDETNEFVGVYVAATMPSGRVKCEWIPREDIFLMRDHSDSYWKWDYQGGRRVKTNVPDPKSGWVVWFDEFAKKSGIKRAQKRLEEAMQDDTRWHHFRQAIDVDNKAVGLSFDKSKAEEAEIIPATPIDETQFKEIMKRVGELKLRDPDRFVKSICGVYGKESLAEVPASKYEEILERIAHAKTEKEARAAAAAKGAK
jgi:recombinational DNA repair protein RecT